mgnify:CR=1 FL=1
MKDKLEKVRKLLEEIDFSSSRYKTENQTKVAEAYKIVDNLIKEIGGTND